MRICTIIIGDSMRKTPFKRCIFFLVDGARADVMEKMIDAGELPAIQRFVLDLSLIHI